MRLTSSELLALSLFATLGLSACTNPPSADGNGTEAGDGDGDGDGDSGDESPTFICKPGETQCKDPETLEVCAATGLE